MPLINFGQTQGLQLFIGMDKVKVAQRIRMWYIEDRTADLDNGSSSYRSLPLFTVIILMFLPMTEFFSMFLQILNVSLGFPVDTIWHFKFQQRKKIYIQRVLNCLHLSPSHNGMVQALPKANGCAYFCNLARNLVTDQRAAVRAALGLLPTHSHVSAAPQL